MNICLLNPPYFKGFSRSQRSPAVIKSGTMYYPFWLASAAGILENDGFRVTLIDAPAENLSKEVVYEKLRNFQPQLIVVDTSTPSINSDLEISTEIKQKHPNSFVGLVGTHPSVKYRDILSQYDCIDWIATGEFENTIKRLANCLRNHETPSQIPGLCTRNGSSITEPTPPELIEDLDELPFLSCVYKKHLKIKNYLFTPASYPMVMLISSRGCPNKCFFCVYPQVMFGHKYRSCSPEYMIEEIQYIKKELPMVKEIVYEDDTFSANLNHIRAFCELKLKKDIIFPWFANLRVDIDYETLQLMKRSGLHSCAVGFETGNQEMLNSMNKGITFEQSLKFSEAARKLNIIVHGCFMVGFPGETKESMEAMFRFAQKLKCDSAQFYPIFLYPGTDAYRWAEKQGYFITKDYQDWLTSTGSHRCVFDLPHLSAEEMMEFCNRAYLRYHLNGVFLLRKLSKVFYDISEVKRAARYGFHYLKYLVRQKSA